MYKIIFDKDKKEYNFIDLKGNKTKTTNNKDNIFNKIIKGNIIFYKLFIRHKAFYMNGIYVFKDNYNIIKKDKIYLMINGKKYYLKSILPFKIKIPILNYRINIFHVKIPAKDLIGSPIHNKVTINYIDKKGYGFNKQVKYSCFCGRKNRYNNKKILSLTDYDSSIYFRQSAKNKLYITNRPINKTDSKLEKNKIFISKILSYLLILFKKNIILLYEKNSSKYEESASVLYEELIDSGYKNAYFILDKECKQLEKINIKYHQNIIFKHTIKHYIYFFIAKSFLSTESMTHAVELRVANKYIYRRFNSNKFNYVFLQHGITYMVSLASHERKAFRKGKMLPLNSKVVVSSKVEAMHFIECANFAKDDLYITGLPKFDKSFKYESADKIVIMPTWRPWEYNLIRVSPTSSGYYKMIKNIISGIPSELKKHVIVLTHPLFFSYLKNTDLEKFIPEEACYDKILRNTDILITDYSSIAFDAFYRGAKVIFWWADLEFCMEKYRGSLLLNNINAFGAICYSKNDIYDALKDQYKHNRKLKYKRRFEKIVEFNDNKNTKRVIEKLINDKII